MLALLCTTALGLFWLAKSSLMDRLHWQSLLAKLSATAKCDSHMIVLALATLDNETQIGSFLFTLCRQRLPRKVRKARYCSKFRQCKHGLNRKSSLIVQVSPLWSARALPANIGLGRMCLILTKPLYRNCKRYCDEMFNKRPYKLNKDFNTLIILKID